MCSLKYTQILIFLISNRNLLNTQKVQPNINKEKKFDLTAINLEKWS